MEQYFQEEHHAESPMKSTTGGVLERSLNEENGNGKSPAKKMTEEEARARVQDLVHGPKKTTENKQQMLAFIVPGYIEYILK